MLAVQGGDILGETAEDNPLEPCRQRCERQHRADRTGYGKLRRIAVDAATDGREGDRAEIVVAGKLQGAAIARGEELLLALVAAAPHRAHGVKDIARRQ